MGLRLAAVDLSADLRQKSHPSVIGRVEPKKARYCLPKSGYSLQIGIKNCTDIIYDRYWPVGIACGFRSIAGCFAIGIGGGFYLNIQTQPLPTK
ncbi:hypothetical protein [Methylomonas koyamae]|uniref:hypothetical protein n=1 Tax=Methylomonas koyamae TaxID=702114 RepID=UPI0012F6D33C|nr:hypothetical protein [Methylomonas koyamae]